jgi:hypothetical protein
MPTPDDLSDFIRSAQLALHGISPALVAIVLLAGPTVLWLVYRFLVQPHTSRYVEGGVDPFWVCENCRSANAVQRSQCYRCGFEPDAANDLELVVGDPADPDVEVSPGVPVGPGRRPVYAPAQAYPQFEDDELSDDEGAGEAPAGAPDGPSTGIPSPGIPVGPGRPTATPPRRSVVAGPRSAPPAE